MENVLLCLNLSIGSVATDASKNIALWRALLLWWDSSLCSE